MANVGLQHMIGKRFKLQLKHRFKIHAFSKVQSISTAVAQVITDLLEVRTQHNRPKDKSYVHTMTFTTSPSLVLNTDHAPNLTLHSDMEMTDMEMTLTASNTSRTQLTTLLTDHKLHVLSTENSIKFNCEHSL